MSTSWDEHDQEVTSCRRCPRLVAWREEVAQKRRRAYLEWEYWGKPVPGFGDRQARLLIVGLAPGAHGSNRTGRMFTGDSSGDFLYAALHRAGFANQPASARREDGLRLTEVYISAVCRCAPPGNKPNAEEIAACLPYLAAELDRLDRLEGIVALGRIAFDYTLRLLEQQGRMPPPVNFSHGAFFSLGDGLPWVLASYHPSRQNTQTGRLTRQMFDSIWEQARLKLDENRRPQK
jgi:uracil-DNA glycosylase family 4